MPKKFLIIRFSSIGDIIQCMGVVNGILNHYPDAEIHWIARKDMSSFLAMDQRIHKIWGFERKDGFKGLLAIARALKEEKFDFIYDAHSNIRSNVLRTVLVPRWKRWFGAGPRYALRSKDRIKRILLFKFGIDRFPMPFRGMKSFRKPLEKWGITDFSDGKREWYFPLDLKQKVEEKVFDQFSADRSNVITIVPSAAWEMKRWPVGHWKQLIAQLPEYHFMILAGPGDSFCEEIRNVAPDRVVNLAGQTSLLESCYLVSQSNLVISADTGFLHAADIFCIPALSLMGPTAFGFTTGEHIKTLEKDMPCRPCTKDGSGKCKMNTYQQCMVDITPEWVAREAKEKMK
ncbi:MAG: glycosyltransferase family 9 protein [Marinifilaceae bacterium]